MSTRGEDGLTPNERVRVTARAVDCMWPITDAGRAKVVQTLDSVLDEESEDGRRTPLNAKLRAVEAYATINGQNAQVLMANDKAEQDADAGRMGGITVQIVETIKPEGLD